jgi:acetyltransferase-like isoleucine patch superfamily enzyme
VSHNTTIGDGATVGHGAVVNGNVRVGPSAWVGPGATISNNLTLGEGCRVALGATVYSDVPDHAHVSGLAAVDHDVALRATAAMRRRRR